MFLSGFWRCFCYLAVIGLLSFFVGRILPKRWFRYDCRSYRPLPFERNGGLYDTLKIRRWKDRVPDMSKILPSLIPPKKIQGVPGTEQVEQMLLETCIAEDIHALLGIAGFVCVRLWDGPGGWVMSLLFLLGNLPFCMIQRYNRPKFVRLLRKLEARETELRKERTTSTHEKRIDLELQYRAGA